METPAKIVNEFYETCNSGQGQGMEAFVADDIEFEGPAMNISGGKKYVEIVKPLCAFHKSMRMFKQLIEGDHVVSIYEMTLGTPGGETLVISFADWIQVVNGKIARQRLYYDPRQFVKAFGM